MEQTEDRPEGFQCVHIGCCSLVAEAAIHVFFLSVCEALSRSSCLDIVQSQLQTLLFDASLLPLLPLTRILSAVLSELVVPNPLSYGSVTDMHLQMNVWRWIKSAKLDVMRFGRYERNGADTPNDSCVHVEQ